MLVKRFIKSGISSETYIQVLEGISEGEEIVTSAYMGMDLEEGMAVTVMPAE